MSYLRFEDTPNGVNGFDDVTLGVPLVRSRTSAPSIATPRPGRRPHGQVPDPVRRRARQRRREGLRDGSLSTPARPRRTTSTVDPEPTPAGIPRAPAGKNCPAAGTASPAPVGNGFLIDNLTLTSTSVGPSPCTFTTSGTTKTLDPDCATTEPIVVPAGKSLDGAGHTITVPEGTLFNGGVIENTPGQTMNVQNVTIEARNLGAELRRRSLRDQARECGWLDHP